MNTLSPPGRYSTAEGRWSGVGPYYAMFPTSFADSVVAAYTKPGDVVLDPFAGRGTAIFSAATQGRQAIGIEINPVGYVYANAKLKPGDSSMVLHRLHEVADMAEGYDMEANRLPKFFHYCYTSIVRRFLVSARSVLNWRKSHVDRTLMALILVSLHGKKGQSLSNQMRQVTAMAPDYSVRWWTDRDLEPPEVDPVAFLTKRIQWRYVYGIPQMSKATVFLHDCVRKLPSLAREVKKGMRPEVNLLLTSPPYFNVTNYYYDQWLRLWMLGGPERPVDTNRYGGKFSNHHRYLILLEKAFAQSKPMLATDAIVYVRTDRKATSLALARSVLTNVYPEKRLLEIEQPLGPEQQTKPYSRGGAPRKPSCEVDLLLLPKQPQLTRTRHTVR